MTDLFTLFACFMMGVALSAAGYGLGVLQTSRLYRDRLVWREREEFPLFCYDEDGLIGRVKELSGGEAARQGRLYHPDARIDMNGAVYRLIDYSGDLHRAQGDTFSYGGRRWIRVSEQEDCRSESGVPRECEGNKGICCRETGGAE
ncbi:hypothetical protein [Hyphomonas pacifica]|uniref:Uncharacterized protein n=1 Tax=Hyphomonas pacifica TaxID=1280941 RepID=A0A8B2PFR4_9PROT|nr:hypothetical protein [Hyphomonas pacifica]RAN30655.1 hypothetical protein HY3_05760 [Hyphomonas pacifica]